MVLGTVPADVSDAAIAFAQQSFRYPRMDALLAASPETRALYDAVQRGIVSNVKTQPGGFKATSGVVLPYYLNLSTNFMDPAVAPSLVRLFVHLLRAVREDLAPAAGEKICIVGPEVAGGMLVAQLAAAVGDAALSPEHFDFVYMRKSRKETGTAQQLEAMKHLTGRTAASPRLRAIWVDDCNSTGSSLCEGITTLERDYAIDVVAAVYVVDRSVDRAALDRSRQRLSDERFVSGHTVIRAVMDLAEIDKLVPKL